jgi:hypothetical protein
VLFNGSGILVRRSAGAATGSAPAAKGAGALRFDPGLFVVEDRDFLRRLADLGPIAARADSAAYALSSITLQRRAADGTPEGPVVIGRGKDVDTIKANVKALFNGMNRLLGA